MTEKTKRPRGDRKPCTWPHAILSVEDEGVLSKMMARYAEYIDGLAPEVALGDEALVEDLKQEARILLWKFGAERLAEMDAKLVRGAIAWRMVDVWREQWSRGGGDRKVVIHLMVA